MGMEDGLRVGLLDGIDDGFVVELMDAACDVFKAG